MDFKLKEFHHNITDIELLQDIKNVASKLNSSTVTTVQYKKFGKYDYNTVYKRFGSWHSTLLKAGLKTYDPKNQKVSDEDLMDNLKSVWIKLGRQPTFSELIPSVSKYSIKPYLTRFKSWRNALEFFIKYINNEENELNPEIYIEHNIKHSTKRDINLRLRFLIMKRDNFKCCICGRSPATTPNLELHIDHIKPWSKGGETIPENLQTLCSDCNLGKSNIE